MFVFARLRPGLVGESRRVSHLVELDAADRPSAHVTSLCGTTFVSGELELMDQWAGMPCLACTLLIPTDSDHTNQSTTTLPHTGPGNPG